MADIKASNSNVPVRPGSINGPVPENAGFGHFAAVPQLSNSINFFHAFEQLFNVQLAT